MHGNLMMEKATFLKAYIVIDPLITKGVGWRSRNQWSWVALQDHST
jgi:hypothetical protein